MTMASRGGTWQCPSVRWGRVPCLDDLRNSIAQPACSLTDATSRLLENMKQAMLLPEARGVETFRSYLLLLDDLKARYAQMAGEFMSIRGSVSHCRLAIAQVDAIRSASGTQWNVTLISGLLHGEKEIPERESLERMDQGGCHAQHRHDEADR